jgi:hypothetical protein
MTNEDEWGRTSQALTRSASRPAHGLARPSPYNRHRNGAVVSECDGRNYTRPLGGKIGFSQIEVVCDDCGHRYWFAVNIGAQLARDEAELRA